METLNVSIRGKTLVSSDVKLYDHQKEKLIRKIILK